MQHNKTRNTPDASKKKLRRLVVQYPDVNSNCVYVKFADVRGRKGQKETPAAGARGIVEVIMLLQGHRAALIRRQAAELLCRQLSYAMGFDTTADRTLRLYIAINCDASLD